MGITDPIIRIERAKTGRAAIKSVTTHQEYSLFNGISITPMIIAFICWLRSSNRRRNYFSLWSKIKCSNPPILSNFNSSYIEKWIIFTIFWYICCCINIAISFSCISLYNNSFEICPNVAKWVFKTSPSICIQSFFRRLELYSFYTTKVSKFICISTRSYCIISIIRAPLAPIPSC